jgi:hypothetical protein
MNYVFESKRDLVYHKNYLALSEALEQAKGNGPSIIDKCAGELLDILARNNIELNPKYIDIPKEPS